MFVELFELSILIDLVLAQFRVEIDGKLVACEFRKAGSLSSSEDMQLAITETLRYGLFLGSFAGTFTSVDELIATLGGHRRSVKSLTFYRIRFVKVQF